MVSRYTTLRIFASIMAGNLSISIHVRLEQSWKVGHEVAKGLKFDFARNTIGESNRSN